MRARYAPEPVLPRRARAAAAEAAFLRLLGILFERPRRGWKEEIRALAADQVDERLRAAAMGALSANEGDYLRLFGPGGAVSPREVAYRGFADPGRVLADLSALYGRFAYHPRAEDPHDHIAVEVGFAGYLAMKKAYLLTVRDREGAARTREARMRFLSTHLRPFASALEARLVGAAGSSWITQAVSILAAWTGRDRSHETSSVAPGPFGSIDREAPLICEGCGEAESQD